MRNRVCRRARWAVLVAFWTPGLSCTPPEPGAQPFAHAPVWIVAMEGLDPPAVGFQEAYQPARRCAANPDQPAAGPAAVFRLTVAVHTPDALRARLHDRLSGTLRELTRIAAPAIDAGGGPDSGPGCPAAATGDLLPPGEPVFWLDDPPGSADAGDTFSHRFAFLVPDSLRGPSTRLEVFAATATDGTPVGADRIELVQGFFYMAVLGDSIAWGNGLLDEDKYPRRVANAIEEQTGRKVIRQTLALSGARIVPDPADGLCGISCYREAPAISTSITAQVDLVERPELIDLVLIDGCINDIGVETIIDPATTAEQLTALSAQFCRDEMTKLLNLVRERMPRAPIVVTGYYPIIGPATDLLGLDTWSQAQSLEPSEDLTQFIEGASANSLVFAARSQADLQAAVDAASAARPGGPGIRLADPGFTPDNALFTPDTWLWGLTAEASAATGLETELLFFPEDPQFTSRLSACFNATGTELSLGCVYASVGHPNPQGAWAYADAIVAALRALAVLPDAPAGQ